MSRVFCVGLLWLLPLAGRAAGGETEALRENFLRVYVGQGTLGKLPTLPTSEADLLHRQGADGRFPGLDYTNHSYPWTVEKHLIWLSDLAKVIPQLSAQRVGDKRVLARAIDTGLRFWKSANPRCENWYQNYISKQFHLAKIALFAREYLAKESVAFIRENLDDRLTSEAANVGANLLWTERNHLIFGAAVGDTARLRHSFGKIRAEISVAPGRKEGIKADGSFHQHWQILYTTEYGLSFLQEATSLVSVASGTAFALPNPTYAVLANFLLDGVQWAFYKARTDYAPQGRTVARSDANAITQRMAETLQTMAALPGNPQAELQRVSRWFGQGIDSLSGHRHYWLSDYTVHRRPGYFISVKGLSVRTLSSECILGVGASLHLISDGFTPLRVDGQEYEPILPRWDWRRLPGVTTALYDEPLPRTASRYSQGAIRPARNENRVSSRGTDRFVGGVTDGVNGASCLRLNRWDVTMQKAWFFFDREIVALGAGISGHGDVPVVTTVEQNAHRGEVSLVQGNVRRALTQPLTDFQGALAFHHRSVGYVFPENVRLAVGVDDSIFHLTVLHGSRPKGANYAYTLLPDVSVEGLEEYLKTASIAVLRNDTTVQAVEHRQAALVQAIFYQPAALPTRYGRIAVDTPVALMLHHRAGHWAITVSNPANAGVPVRVTFGTQTFTIDMPGGDRAGSSVTLNIN